MLLSWSMSEFFFPIIGLQHPHLAEFCDIDMKMVERVLVSQFSQHNRMPRSGNLLLVYGRQQIRHVQRNP